MTALASLLFGLGVWNIFRSLWVTEDRQRPVLRQLHTWHRKTAEFLSSAGLNDSKPVNFYLLVSFVGSLGLLIPWLLQVPVVYVVLFPLVASVIPVILVMQRREKIHLEREKAWPDAIDQLLSALRSGMNLPESLCQLSDHGPKSLQPYFTDFAFHYRSGAHLADCLDELRDRMKDPIADRLVATIQLAAQAGGQNLGRCLALLGSFLRKEAHLRGELRARQSWTSNSARLAVAAPWLVLLLMYRQPGYAHAFHSPTGNVIVFVGAVACCGAYWLMKKLAHLPRAQRITV